MTMTRMVHRKLVPHVNEFHRDEFDRAKALGEAAKQTAELAPSQMNGLHGVLVSSSYLTDTFDWLLSQYGKAAGAKPKAWARLVQIGGGEPRPLGLLLFDDLRERCGARATEVHEAVADESVSEGEIHHLLCKEYLKHVAAGFRAAKE
jgi:hypothetical protein